MKKILTVLFLLVGMLLFATNTYYYPIVAAGATYNVPLYDAGTTYIDLTGSATLSAGITMQYASLPPVGANWTVWCDFTGLNANGQVVSIFGIVPQDSFPTVDKFLLTFWVNSDNGTPALHHSWGYPSPNIYPASSIPGTPTFTNGLTADSPVVINQLILVCDTCAKTPTAALPSGRIVTTCDACDSLTKLNGRFWRLTGNSGTTGSNYLGTTDAHSLRFATNGTQRMYIDSATGNINIANTTFPPPSALTVGVSSNFQVNSSGNLVSVNGVQYTWPASQGAANSTLSNSDGAGTLVWKPSADTGTTWTPNTGDSLLIVNQKNTINPAGTLANLTLILPASTPSNPINWKVFEFSFQQVITAIHYSIRISGGAVQGLPTPGVSQYQSFSTYWNPTLQKWIIN